MRRNRFLWWFLLVYTAGLVGLACWFRHALNADAVAYLRLASYYAQGKWALAVSGYWGPLASWVMAGFLQLGLPPLPVARGFMCGSALVFVWGCLAVYRAFELPDKWVTAGTVLAAAAGCYWSVQFITPDLLLSGLIALAVSRMLPANRPMTIASAVSAGLLWGLAYLTKAVAFPLAILVTVAFAAGALGHPSQQRSAGRRQAVVVFLVFSLVAAPWVLTLSLKYRAPMFSTTPRITHTLTGPPDAERYHPFGRTLHRPEPGRITSWEEPSRMAYNDWSPFESPAYAWHQVQVLARNMSTCLALLTSLNVSWLALIFAWALEGVRRRDLLTAAAGWGRALVLPSLLVLLYLPCYVTLTEQRFFYAAFPFLFSALGLWSRTREQGLQGETVQTNSPDVRAAQAPASSIANGARVWWLAVLGASVPLAAAVFVIGSAPKFAGDCAAELANRLARANFTGPVAGSAMLPGGRAGLYVAYLLDQPWYGDKPRARPADFQASGARLVLAVRGSELAEALAEDGAFTDLDSRLFTGATEAAQFPLRAFEVRAPQGAPTR